LGARDGGGRARVAAAWEAFGVQHLQLLVEVVNLCMLLELTIVSFSLNIANVSLESRGEELEARDVEYLRWLVARLRKHGSENYMCWS